VCARMRAVLRRIVQTPGSDNVEGRSTCTGDAGILSVVIPDVGVSLRKGRGSRLAILCISEEGNPSAVVELGTRDGLVLPKLTQLDGPMGAHITWFGVIARTSTGDGAVVLGSEEGVPYDMRS
jgi:hypothetical protein